MQSLPFGLAAAGFLIVVATWIIYFSTIPRGKVPVSIWSSVCPQIIGVVMAVSALVLSYREGGSVNGVVLAPACLALMMGFGFFWLMSQRKTPVGELKVKLGDKLLPFQANTSEGSPFHSDTFAGKRVLLKFFRGGW